MVLEQHTPAAARPSAPRPGDIMEAVAYAAERFLTVPVWHEAAQDVIARLGQATAVSRTYLFEIHPGPDGEPVASQRYEWAAPGVVPQLDNPTLQNIRYDEPPQSLWYEGMLAGLPQMSHVRDLDPTRRTGLEEQDIRSILIVPIFVEGALWGSVGFDQCDRERVWSEPEVDALKAAAGILGAAIRMERSRAALRESEERYRRLVELSPDAIAIHTEGRFVFANPATAALLGADRPEDLLGMPIMDVVHPDYRDIVRERVRTMAEGGDVAPLIEERFVRLDGSVIDVEVTGIPFTFDGRPGSQVVIRDVTARSRAVSELRGREAVLASVAFAAERFLQEAAWEGTIHQVLARLGEAADVSRAYVFQNHLAPDGRMLASQRHEWVAPGVTREIANPAFQDFSLRGSNLGDWEDALARGETVQALVRDLPVEQQASLHPQGVRSIVIVPVLTGTEPWGFIGFDQCDRERTWSRPELDALKAAAGILGATIERQRSQHVLRQAERNYRRLVELSPDGIVVHENGRLVFANPTAVHMVGAGSVADLVGRPVLDFVHEDSRAMVVERMRRMMESGEDVPITEERFVRLDGSTFDVEVSASPLTYEGHRAIQVVVRDISERKLAEEAIRANEARLRQLVEQIAAVTYIDVPDSDQTIYISPQIEDLVGYSPQEWTEDPALWKTILHPEDRERVIAEDVRTGRTGEKFDVEYRLVARDGHVVWIRDQSVLMRDDEGNPKYWQGVYVEVTELKRAEEVLRSSFERERDAAQRLRTLDDMKNTFLAAVSHELRTPLSAILGLALTLERDEITLEPGESADLLHRLAANARKLDRLLSDLLDLDRLSRGIVEPRRRPTDVGALVRQVIEGTEIEGTHVVRVQAESTIVSVDPAKVERIAENLVVNAGRYTAPGTTIWVRVRPDAGGVLIEVEDEGPGVPEDLREAIFQPFQQGPGRRSHSPGVGVGLSLVARFAELHGGRAWVEPREGGGSSFRVYLPDTAGDGPVGHDA